MSAHSKKDGSTTVVGAVSDELNFGDAAGSITTVSARVMSHGKLAPAMFRVRKLASERGINLEKVQGSGPNGTILESDLK